MEIIDFRTQKAIKEHTCNWCNEKIKIGQKYNRGLYKEDDIYIWKSHIYCLEIAQKLKVSI
jgi:hypothetical protein